MRRLCGLLSLSLALTLSGCSAPEKDNTLGSLASQSVVINTDTPLDSNYDQAIDVYEGLTDTDNAKLSLKAIHHLADLEMARIEQLQAEEKDDQIKQEDYDKAIKWYQELLLRQPNYPQRETVLYQLARAYEESGRTDKSLKALDIISRDYPNSARAPEANFRRGETLFALERYREAEVAYSAVVTAEKTSSFHEQALFKYAWSIYKQDRCLDSLDAFFVILDRKLNKNLSPTELATFNFLSRSDKELVNDSFRAINLCLSTEGGGKALNHYLDNKAPRIYEFIVYQKLADHNIKQKLENEAAEVLRLFSKRSPWHPYALLFQDQAIHIYTKLGLKEKVIPAKEEYVSLYEAIHERWKNNVHNNYFEYLIRGDAKIQKDIKGLLEQHLYDLAEYYHAIAQKTSIVRDYTNAITWYKKYLEHFPHGEKSAKINYRLAEAMYENKLFSDAAREYERTAYEYGQHKYASDAGYAALVAYEDLKEIKGDQDISDLRKLSTKSALNFSRTFPRDPRAPEALIKAADELYQAEQYDLAIRTAETFLNRYPDATAKTKRTALIVLANTQFERSEYAVAELFYSELYSLLTPKDPLKKEIYERMAACIYKQAESFRSQGVIRSAIEQFQRLIEMTPESSVRPIAEYDVASALILINEWETALVHLESFKQHFPDHELIKDVNEKIAVGYLKLEKPVQAATALAGIAQEMDPGSQREALWQVAELYEKGGDHDKAIEAYIRYAETFPSPLEPAIEAHYKAALSYKEIEREDYYLIQMEKIYRLDKDGGKERSNRTRYLAAKGAFELASPHFKRYSEVELVEPIRKNMQLKNVLMKQALKAYNKTVDVGVAEFTTAATFRIADMYADFSAKLMDSDRPTNLNEEELEQYEIMLEEQAFPFEEKAIDIHTTNVNRMHDGLYNEWVGRSINALAQLLPARYSRTEHYDIPAPTL